MSQLRAYQLIRQARERAGMSAAEFASRVGLTSPEYFDVEAHPDEFITVIAMGEARALCKELDLRLVDVVASEPLDADFSLGQESTRGTLPRSAFLRQRRESLGISIAELAFAIGFEEVTVEEIERDERHLDSLPIAVVAEISRKLELPLVSLMEADSVP
jgi:transcriptional regulator with XRE-family HTH domain